MTACVAAPPSAVGSRGDGAASLAAAALMANILVPGLEKATELTRGGAPMVVGGTEVSTKVEAAEAKLEVAMLVLSELRPV